MIKLYFIGTGAGGSPGSRRWRASTLVDFGEKMLLVDCGVGCHYRLSERGLLNSIDAIYVTHLHMDHFLGIPELLFQAHIEGRKKDITIFAPHGMREIIAHVGPHLFTAINFKINVVEIYDGFSYNLDSFKLEVYEVCHTLPSYALKISNNNLSLLFSSDTGELCQKLLDRVKHIDVLIHEATCDEENKNICKEYGHSTNIEACMIANSLNAKILILNHIDEYFNKNLRNEIDELKKLFKGELIIAEDNYLLII
ncbi:MAG: MBL fold metallo-hydrolase [Thermoprotei archaeon]|jgi:ribonuclease Z